MVRVVSVVVPVLGLCCVLPSEARADSIAAFGVSSAGSSVGRLGRSQSQSRLVHLFQSTAVSSSAAVESEGPVVGDTRGAALWLEGVSVSRGSNSLLEDVTWRVEPKTKWGICGPNGAGKSTLLGAILGSVRRDEGTCVIAPKQRLGYLRQTAVSPENFERTVFDEASSEMIEITTAQAQMDLASERLQQEGLSPEEAQRAMGDLEKAQERFEAAGGYTQEQVVAKVLQGLGFRPTDSARRCSEFSGGWQMRIALARLLLSQPSLLLLDEPTNHLDSSARDWLAQYLAQYDGTLVVVSHDTVLLENSISNICEVVPITKNIETYISCTYSEYKTERAFRLQVAQSEYERNQAEAAKLQSFVDRFGASATKASSAQSRVKQLEKMAAAGKLDSPISNGITRDPVLHLPNPPKPHGEYYMTLDSASIGYAGPNNPILLTNVNLKIPRGMKLILRGPNGCGKSTLLASLRGSLELRGGTLTSNEKLRLGIFTQDLAQELDVTQRAVDLVLEHAREEDFSVTDGAARNVMGALGLGGDKALRKVGDLSGGEKARVALSMFALKTNNLLMLDEPSNHLDVPCIAALGKALSEWGGKDGSMVVISHDRAFCETVGFTHVGTVKDGRLIVEERDLKDADWDQYNLEASTSIVETTADNHNNGDTSVGPPLVLTQEEKDELKRKRKLAFNAPKRIQKLEGLVEKAEAKVAELDTQMMEVGTDVGKLVDLSKEKEILEAKVIEYMEEWEELENILEEVKNSDASS
eukprot:scaffold52611_cov48-Attheya_sp.AAC.2